jgi:hypothetical protein
MHKSRILLLFLAASACTCTVGQSRAPAQASGSGSPGAYGPYPQQQQQQYPSRTQMPAPAPQTAAPTAQIPAVPAGSTDAEGALANQFMRQEPLAVLAELVQALPEASAARVRGLPLLIKDDPKEVNAFAACTRSGGIVAITSPLLLIIARTSEARAYDEIFGTSKYNDLSNGIADEVKQQKAVAGPPAGFLPLPQAADARKLARQRVLFDEQIAFVLGHELAHHHRGHIGCANGASQQLTPQDIGRVLSDAVPIFNQPNEIDADVQGTFNLLDAGAKRQAAKWTEEGSLMSLDFFSRLESLGVETVLLAFLSTHPLPEVRQPIVQTAATAWRANGGKAPAFPVLMSF